MANQTFRASNDPCKRMLAPSNHRFYSEWHQDWMVANVLREAGVMGDLSQKHLTYVDLAANDAQRGSNSYYFDRCLKARGVCIEPNPHYHAGIMQKRSCALEGVCVSDAEVVVDFVMRGPLGHIAPGRQLAKIKCVPLRTLLAGHALRHINYLSLDIEGAELGALRSIDWHTTTVDTITIENSSPEISDFLAQHKLRPTLCSSLDTLYTREGAVQLAAQRWYAQRAQYVLPNCITNQTELCTDKPNWSFIRCAKAEGRIH